MNLELHVTYCKEGTRSAPQGAFGSLCCFDIKVGGPGWDSLTELETIAVSWRLQGRPMRSGARAFDLHYTVFTDAAYRALKKLRAANIPSGDTCRVV